VHGVKTKVNVKNTHIAVVITKNLAFIEILLKIYWVIIGSKNVKKLKSEQTGYEIFTSFIFFI
jgi:thymidylate synthase